MMNAFPPKVFFYVRIEDARLLAPFLVLLMRHQLRVDPLVHPLCVNLAHLVLRQFFFFRKVVSTKLQDRLHDIAKQGEILRTRRRFARRAIVLCSSIISESKQKLLTQRCDNFSLRLSQTKLGFDWCAEPSLVSGAWTAELIEKHHDGQSILPSFVVGDLGLVLVHTIVA